MKRLRRVGLVWFFLAAGLSLAGVEDLVAKGDAAFDAFDNRSAMEYYREAYRQSPRDVRLLTRLTWACNNVGEDLDSKASEPYFEEAVRYAEALGTLAPERAETHFLLAISSGNLALYKGGREKVRLSRHVERDAKRAIAIDPGYSPAYAALGVYYREVATLNWALKLLAKSLLGGLPDGTLGMAEEMFLTAIEKDAANAYAHYQLAVTYEVMKEPRKAAVYYRKVLEIPVADHQDPVFQRQARARLAVIGK
ncbi:MAG: tetratricopeptide repeat protein [Lentisphaeria bacterium]|nr:tetratricopeptide repeat protein [Lentisphaeria bacterium]